jgi:Family of unknown function (DUF6463)
MSAEPSRGPGRHLEARSRDARARFLSPGYMTMAVGVGHAVWGLIAYRSALRNIARAGYVDSVGDGLFRTDHSQDERAAAFWFMFAAPLIVLAGYLEEVAIRSQDRRAVATAGVAMVLIAAPGAAVIPRSGFPLGLPLGPWLIHRARQMGPADSGAEAHRDVETPHRVRWVQVPPTARALNRLARVDYEDAFIVEIGRAQDRTAERWARAIFDDAPMPIRRPLRWAWLAQGLKLGSARSDRLVLGWELRDSTPDFALLGADSRIGMPAEILFMRQQDSLLVAVFVQHENPIARAVWAVVQHLLHRRLSPSIASSGVARFVRRTKTDER